MLEAEDLIDIKSVALFSFRKMFVDFDLLTQKTTL